MTFEYSAWSSIIAEARDFSCAVYDAETPPNALCVFDGLPIHVNAQPVAIGEIAKFFGPEELHDGDLILVNSAYYGNTHLGDFVLATPVFYKGEHLFWSAATGHHMDVGSAYRTSVPTYATDIWSEGLQISPLKIADRGEMRKDVLNFLLENVRYRDFIYGDLMSQIGSAKTGKKRLLELLDTWGADTLKRFSREIIAYADRRTREEFETWPDGIYESEAWVDSDGYGRTDIAIRCKLTIEGHKLTVDFDGSDPQGRGGVNAGWATCRNSVVDRDPHVYRSQYPAQRRLPATYRGQGGRRGPSSTPNGRDRLRRRPLCRPIRSPTRCGNVSRRLSRGRSWPVAGT